MCFIEPVDQSHQKECQIVTHSALVGCGFSRRMVLRLAASPAGTSATQHVLPCKDEGNNQKVMSGLCFVHPICLFFSASKATTTSTEQSSQHTNLQLTDSAPHSDTCHRDLSLVAATLSLGRSSSLHVLLPAEPSGRWMLCEDNTPCQHLLLAEFVGQSRRHSSLSLTSLSSSWASLRARAY